jgi:MSHA biogenesis protein MshN
MSLINQLLQDLERRRASGAEARALSPRVRALPGRSRRGPLMAAGLLAVAAVVAIGLTYYFRPSQSEPALLAATSPKRPPEPPAASPAVPVAPIPPEPVVVREALTVPVFQLAEELRTVPPPPALESETGRDKSAVRPSVPARKPLAAAPAQPKRVPPPAPPVAAAPAPPAAAAAEPGIEEVILPDARSPVPVEKQMREPTAYERAELEFRNAVARLRQGRVVDAEAGFRAALKEDRSHAGARQALISLLIDAKRNADAEEVLREALTFNPRQPRHAMLLARLELERGDTASAARTLEAARTYAGLDADYHAFLAAVYQRLERHERAVEFYASALAVAPGNALWMMGLAISLQALQRNDEARDAFRRAADSRTLNADLQAFVESRLRELSPPKR